MSVSDRMLFVGIVVLSVAFRTVDVFQPLIDAFSWREASTAMMADNFPRNSWNIFFPEVSWVGPSPGYQGRELPLVPYIAAVLYSLFGWHDWLGRVIAISFSILTIISLHRLTARLWGEKLAHYTAFAYAILPGAIQVDRSFLPDPAMLALVTSASWIFLLYLDKGGAWRLALATALFTIGTLVKLPGFAVAPVILYLLVARARYPLSNLRFMGPVIAAATCSLIAIASYYAWAIHIATTYPPYHMSGAGYIWQDGVASFLKSGFYLSRLYNTIFYWMMSWTLIAVTFVGLIAGPPQQERSDSRGRWVFHVWFLGAFAIYLLAAREISSNVWNLHNFSVPVAAFLGRGLMALVTLGTPSTNRIWIPVRFAVLSALLIGMGTIPYAREMRKPIALNSMLLGRALNELSAPGDLVITVATDVGDPTAIYYSRRRGWVFPPGGGQFDWSTFVDDKKALLQLTELRKQGAKWFGATRDAVDSKRENFFDHHAGVIAELEKSASRVEDTPEYVIYRID